MHHAGEDERAALGGRPLMGGSVRVDHAVTQRHLLARRRDLRRRQQHLGGRRRRRVRRDRRPALGRRHPGRRRRPHGEGDPAHPRPRRPLPGRAGAARGRRRADLPAPRRQAAVGRSTPRRDYLWDLDLPDGWELSVAGTTIRTLHTPGHAPGACCFLRRGPRLRLHRRHAVPGRPRRDRAVVLGPADCSRRRSGPSSSRCRTTPSCTPATATTPRSARSGPTRSTGTDHGGFRTAAPAGRSPGRRPGSARSWPRRRRSARAACGAGRGRRRRRAS